MCRTVGSGAAPQRRLKDTMQHQAKKFVYVREEDWPPLAWLAECADGAAEIIVHCGARVETRPDGFCEGVWDGDFDAGDLDLTDT